MNNRPPRNPLSLARQYPTLEGVAVPNPLKTAIRHAYQHIYDLRDDLLKRISDLSQSGGSGGCSCSILKGVVPTEGDLPTTGNEAGDGWIVEDTGHLWVWDGTVWVDAGPILGPPGPPGADGAPGPPGADGAPGAPGAGSPAYLSSLFAGPDTTRTISGATHLYTTPGLLVMVYDNATPRNAIEAGWTVNATTYDVIITFAAPQSNYYVVINGATGMQGPAGSGGGSGTVTSVALTVPAEFSVSGSPVTTSGTLAVSKATQSANTVYAGPTTGSAAAPAFRAVDPADLPLTSSSAFGACKVDGITVVAAAGVISAVPGGASGSALVAPPLTGWTWDSQGTSTDDESSGSAIILRVATRASGSRWFTRAAPSTPYVIEATFQTILGGDTALNFGFGDGTKGIVWHLSTNSTCYIFKFSASSTPVAPYTSMAFPLWAGVNVLLKIADDGTNIKFSYKMFNGGEAWVQLHSVSRTDYIAGGPTKVLFGAYTNNSDVAVRCADWKVS